MPILTQAAQAIALPNLVPHVQTFEKSEVNDVFLATKHELQEMQKEHREKKGQTQIKPGQSVAVLVGSRNIAKLPEVVRATIDYLKEIGALPFIIPSMGSHGGGIAQEQENILARYGVTESSMGVPIRASMDTVVIAETSGGVPIHIDQIAAAADHIVPIARIKAHTSFNGPIESGFCKMITIGLGKHNGCSALHKEGFDRFAMLIPEAAELVLAKKSIPFGVGVIENAYESVHKITVVSGDDFLSEEPKLLKESKTLMPRLCFSQIDVLIVEQIGKDISGTGMDPNITGRSVPGRVFPFHGPDITRIVVLGLSAGTHGNASGIGRADFITQRCFDQIDQLSTYANCVAAGVPDSAKIPIVLADEEEAVRAALQTCPGVAPKDAKIVKIKDTLHLIEIRVSENLLAR